MNHVRDAATLFAAIELAEKALRGMSAEQYPAVPAGPLEPLADAIAELQAVYDALPEAILNAVADAGVMCRTCRHMTTARDRFGRSALRCTAPTGEHCPVARACGFRTASDQGLGIAVPGAEPAPGYAL